MGQTSISSKSGEIAINFIAPKAPAALQKSAIPKLPVTNSVGTVAEGALDGQPAARALSAHKFRSWVSWNPTQQLILHTPKNRKCRAR
jgi:hypothetical protein